MHHVSGVRSGVEKNVVAAVDVSGSRIARASPLPAPTMQSHVDSLESYFPTVCGRGERGSVFLSRRRLSWLVSAVSGRRVSTLVTRAGIEKGLYPTRLGRPVVSRASGAYVEPHYGAS